MKAINFYSLIVTLLLVLVCFLFFKQCSTKPPEQITQDKHQYDSVVKVLATANQVIDAVQEQRMKDSISFEKKIAVLKKEKSSATADVSVLKKRVGDLNDRYNEARNKPEMLQIVCDSIRDEHDLLVNAFENQLYVTDSIVNLQEQEIDGLRNIIQKEKEFRNKFMSAGILKDQKYNVLFDQYNKLYKKNKAPWNNWIKPALGFTAGAAAGFFASKAIYNR